MKTIDSAWHESASKYALGEWRNRVSENLFACLRMHIEDTEKLPTPAEYAEAARYAMEHTVK